ncbi:shikimate kinase, partial [Singulisphaera rosea]
DPRGLADRPALTSAGTIAELAGMIEAREPLYRDVADAVINTEGRSAAEVVDAILERWSPTIPARS